MTAVEQGAFYSLLGLVFANIVFAIFVEARLRKIIRLITTGESHFKKHEYKNGDTN